MYFKSIIFAVLFFICLINITAQDRQAEAEKIFSEAETLRVAKDADSRRKAIEKFNQAILIFKELGLREREASAINNIGYIYKNLGEFEKSLGFFEKSLQINREINNKKGQFAALLNMGQSNRYLSRKQEAAAQVNEALAISRELGDKEKEAAALNELGVFYYRNGEIQKSLESFGLAASIFDELGKQIPQAVLLNNIGLINRIYGNQQDAIEKFKKALEIFREAKHRDGEADALLNLAAMYGDMFRTAEAMEYYSPALSIFRESGNRQREAVILNSIGVFYSNLGDYSKALDYYAQAAEIAEKIGNKRQFASALKNLGVLYLNLDDSDKALNYLNNALESSREVKNRLDEGWILNNIGMVYDKKGNYEKAKQLMRESLKLLREIGNQHGEANTLYNLGTVFEKTNEKGKALENYAEALKIRRELSSAGEEAKILLATARIERDSGNLRAAQINVEQAIEKIESLRAGIPDRDLRTTFFSLGKDTYDFYISLLMQMNDEKPQAETIAKAFESSERSRARSLLESLFESRTEIRRGVDAKLLERERSLQNRLNARERYRMNLLGGKPQPEDLEAVGKEIRSLLDEYQQIRMRIRTKSPRYADLTEPQPLSLEEIQQSILDSDTILLEYSLGEENSYLWMVTKDSVETRKLPKRDKIAAVARRFYESLNARNEISENETIVQRQIRLDTADKELAKSTRELSEMIVPFDASKIGNKRLLIVAEGILQYISFAALEFGGGDSKVKDRINDKKYLIETNQIVYLPSASTLAVLRKTKEIKKSEPKNVVTVLADPVFSPDDVRVKPSVKNSAKKNGSSENSTIQNALDKSKPRSEFSRLRFSRREAEVISRLVSDKQEFVALDFAASSQTAKSSEIQNSRIVHFATHGFVNSEYPELSGIVLSLVDENGNPQDGYLRLHDIYNLPLNADLVVLSACETALGKELKGEGIVGLTRGFMYAGSQAVAASLWKVDDRATAELMRRFYENMLKENLRPADALRKAQISLIKNKQTRHPFYWAAFTLQGEYE